jgi:hypothetical protein
MTKIEVKAETVENDRSQWSTHFPCNELKAAAEKKAAYHKDHADKWDATYAKAIAERKKTERIDEQPVTGGVNRIVRYDPGLDAQVSLALSKREVHRAAQREYDAWVRFFDHAHSEATMLCRQQDVRYFFDEDPE